MNHSPGRPRDPAANRRSLPTGRQPWDPANGLRVGTMAGGLLGAAIVALSGISNFWIVAVCAGVGAGIGYWTEKPRQRNPAVGSANESPQDR